MRHAYIDTAREDAAARLQNMGGAQAILATIGHPDTISALMGGLAPQGRLLLRTASRDLLPVSARQVFVGEHCELGSITGSPYEHERTLEFSVLAGVRPMIEVMPLEQANEAYRKMKSGDARFRMRSKWKPRERRRIRRHRGHRHRQPGIGIRIAIAGRWRAPASITGGSAAGEP